MKPNDSYITLKKNQQNSTCNTKFWGKKNIKTTDELRTSFFLKSAEKTDFKIAIR